MTKLRATTALATSIAGVDRQRFNEAIADGFYSCAPKTIPGRARQFDASDILALSVYKQLIDEGVIPRHAGEQACGLRWLLAEHPDADRVVRIKCGMGSAGWHLLKDCERSLENGVWAGLMIVNASHWYLEPIRQRIIAELEDAHNVVGDPDEED